MTPRGRDTTGRPLDPEADQSAGRGRQAGGRANDDRGSPAFSEDFGGEVVRPARGESAGAAVATVDFSDAVSDDQADIGRIVRSARVDEILAELDRDLIALEPVKRRIREIAALLVIGRLREEMGLTSTRPTLHMSFTGNPGTGKTTVALRMASILHRLGYVDRGHLVSVTRDDLVGQYVGHTAPKTKDVVKRALGGVLFIDEAYYLYRPENERDYGPEAIEVLLQVMERERHNLVVVMAGYGDRMSAFFEANPGMGSRIAHHIAFPDYTPVELMQIAELMIDQQGYELSEDANSALHEYLERRLERPRFAHGRSVRNALERARMRHAQRLFEQAGDSVSRQQLLTIEAEDIRGSSVFDDLGDGAESDHTPAGTASQGDQR